MRRLLAAMAMVPMAPGAVGPTEASVDRLVAAGRAAAEPDFAGLAGLCDVKAATTVIDWRKVGRNGLPPPQPLAPRAVFDNLYFVGVKDVSAWVIRTSAGLILVDALNNDAESRSYVAGGLRKLGLDPANIRYLILTHGHGDHYGGAGDIVESFHPRVLASATDWALMHDPARRIDIPGWGAPPATDVEMKGKRQRLTLGDTTVELLLTPGHTEGTISLAFPVRQGKSRHRAILWGGTGFNFGPLPDRFAAYARSARETRRLVLAQGIDVFLSNHAKRDGTIEKLAALDADATGTNPFVLTPPRVAKAFEVFRDCALAAELASRAGSGR
jgi:metallo-beta-lactamase class B